MKLDITITMPSEGLTITGKNEQRVKVEIPDSWDKVPFEKYLKIVEAGENPVKWISIFTNLDEEMVKNAKLKNLSAVMAALNFMKKPPVYFTPSTILGYTVVSNLETESIAQYSDLQDICKNFKENETVHNLSYFPLIVATYAVSPYDFKEAEKIKDQFLYAPCTEVLAIGNFTLVRLHALNSGILPTSPQADTRLNRLKQALADWLKSLDSSIRFYTWKRSLPLNERRYLSGR